MTDYRSYYTPIPTDERYIRLLTIHPGSGRDFIHIELQQRFANIDDLFPPPYDALSYVWGSEHNQVWVLFGPDGQSSRPVTQNLAQALSYLRYPDRERTVWIDAVCIDQENIREKSSQVAMMSHVYQTASRVIVWLGRETKTTFRGLELIEEIGSQVEVFDWTHNSIAKLSDAVDSALIDDFLPLPYSDYDVGCMKAIFRRPWFQRLWVRQEVALAKEAYVQIGVHSVSFLHLANAIAIVHAKGTALEAVHQVRQSKRLRVAYLLACVPAKKYDFRDIHILLRGTYCKDPRDRIYAILSLLWSDAAREIVPDYSAPVSRVYRDAFAAYLRRHRHLHLLDSCTFFQTPQRPQGLCSWVPDWSSTPNIAPINVHTSAGGMFYPDFQYRVGNVLTVFGLDCCGKITALDRVDRTDIGATADSIYTFFANMSPSLDPHQPYVAGGSLLDAICCTLVFDRFPKNFRLAVDFKVPYFSTMSMLIGDLFALGTIETGHERLDSQYATSMDDIREWLRGWSLFTTADGYIGAAPECSEPGDIVILIPGLAAPKVLRPLQGNKYHIIGTCYVHGIMQGEPFLGPLPDGIRQWMNNYYDATRGDIRYKNSVTGESAGKDPRFEMRGVDISAYYHDIDDDGFVRVDASALKACGVQLKSFDLV